MTEKKTAVPRPDTINGLVAGIYGPMAMLAGMRLDVFTPLKDGPMDAAALGAALGLDPARVAPLLYALVNAGLLTVADGVFANTAESAAYLVKGERRYMGSSHEAYSDLWGAMLHTAESIRAGRPQCMHDFSEMSRDELATFLRGLDAGANAAGRKLVKDYGLAEFRHLLDVGGGSGGLARAVCEAVPGLDATVTDLPTVADLARAFNEKAGFADRIRILANDTVAAPPEGTYDLAVLRNFLQVLGPDQARAALIHVGQVTAPGGTVFIIGRVLDDSRLTPADTAGMNLVFLNIYAGGQSYTESQHRAWLAEAGFEDMTRAEIASGYSILRARKAG